jgi:hypothetical protein
MPESDRTASEPERTEPELSPFERFPSLTRRLVRVCMDDLREARDQEKRRTA